jgi:hypothetical protein
MLELDMNERIRELAEQAGIKLTNNLVDGVNGPGVVTEKDKLEKFAELIVKDCASICEINGQSYKHSFTPAKARLAESTSNHCAMMINKHFGV